ncbi:MAG: tetratricopeptide repeat protein, partial [Deltaproteobacteria bacterium]|nr:tetratricopeptide repeat protein [Deltaproteobacteria bacterium]
AHNNLAVALKRNGDLEKALDVFNRAVGLREGYAEAWSNRGWVHFEQEKWREARADFEKALSLNPQDQGALYGMSRVLKQQRDYVGAQQALRKLISRSPNFVYWLQLAQLQLVRYYWVLILIALAFLVHSKYRKMRLKSYGS